VTAGKTATMDVLKIAHASVSAAAKDSGGDRQRRAGPCSSLNLEQRFITLMEQTLVLRRMRQELLLSNTVELEMRSNHRGSTNARATHRIILELTHFPSAEHKGTSVTCLALQI